MGSRRLGRRRLDSLMEVPRSKNDEWGYVRPPMVPGLRRNLKVACMGQMHAGGVVDLLPVADNATTGIWLFDDANSGAVTAINSDGDFTDGSIQLAGGNSAGNQTAIGLDAAPISCASSTKRWWMEASIKVANHDDAEFFFGVTENAITVDSIHLEAAGAGTDRIGFVKAAHNVDAIQYAHNKNGDGTIAAAFPTALTYAADNDVLNMALHWDGSVVKLYHSQAATGTEPGDMTLVKTISSNIPDDSSLRPILFQETTGATNNIQVNYIRVAWEV